MTILWRSSDVDEVLHVASSAPWTCSGISIDTRTLQKGDLFIPLVGENGDGHAYLQEAADKGASAAFVSQDVTTSLPILQVEDTLEALEKVGVAARKRTEALRIAITGSVGKTSTKEALKTILQDQGPTHSNVSSYNNQWGVPLSLARMPQDTKFGIFEVGMNHPGEIRSLSQMIKPQIAIITSIAEAHTEFFTSMAAIAHAKAEIFEGTSSGDIAILNQDNPYFDLLSTVAREHSLKIYGFGRSKAAACQLLSWECKATESHVVAKLMGEEFSYTLPVPGIHWVMNSLAILTAAFLAGVDMRQVMANFAHIETPQGRGKRYEGVFTILDESYNANPASMRAALAVLGKSSEGRKIAVLGDMRELGEQARDYHEALLDPLIEHGIDKVFCCGPFMHYLYERLPQGMQGGYAPTSLELIPLVLQAVEPGDTISVKASLGTRVKPIVEALIEQQKSGEKA